MRQTDKVDVDQTAPSIVKEKLDICITATGKVLCGQVLPIDNSRD